MLLCIAIIAIGLHHAKLSLSHSLCVYPQTGEVIYMPVPSSFNEITQNRSLREFVGWVWYDREVWVPASWGRGQNCITLRFESAHYNSIAVGVYYT